MLKEFLECYKIVFQARCHDFLNIPATLIEEKDGLSQVKFYGIVSLVGITGEGKGRIILYFTKNLLRMLYRTIYDEDASYENELYEIAAEINNIVSGNAVTLFNDKSDKRFFLSPPSIFSGNLSIITPKINSRELVYKIGDEQLIVSIGLEGGME